MLYVKDLLFLDGAIATLAPDLDLFGTLTEIGMHFATAHGAKIANDVGMAINTQAIDITAFKASIGVEASVETLTYADLQKRRALIAERMEGQEKVARNVLRDLNNRERKKRAVLGKR
jgi:ubiquinone biosynthesis protein